MIVITAPTGNIGHQVLEHVLAGSEPVRVIVRDPSDLPAEMPDLVDIVQGSHGDADVVDRAFAGAEAVFWLLPPDPKAESVEAAYVDFTRPACKAFRTQGVKRVVGITALGRGTLQADHAGLVTGSFAMDDLIAGSGASYRAVANPSFMDNLLMQADSIRDKGMFFSPIDGDRKLPACTTRDIAAVSADLHVAVLGPEDLSFNDMAEIMSDVLGRPIRFGRTSFDDYDHQFTGFGMSEAMARGMTDITRAKSEGLDNAEPRTPASTTPTSFRRWCEEELRPAILG